MSSYNKFRFHVTVSPKRSSLQGQRTIQVAVTSLAEVELEIFAFCRCLAVELSLLACWNYSMTTQSMISELTSMNRSAAVPSNLRNFVLRWHGNTHDLHQQPGHVSLFAAAFAQQHFTAKKLRRDGLSQLQRMHCKPYPQPFCCFSRFG